MPRTHGRVMSAIWNDGDFINMRRGAQGMFMFLLSQPDLSHAGLVPMRVNRWAKKAEDLSAKQVRSELDYLADRDFVVVDEDTEEVLIRTMVRNDGVYKQPLVMERMREDAKQIESPMLREAFAAELDRLPLDELSTEPAKNGGPSVRERVERVCEQLRDDFSDEIRASREALERVTDTPHAGARTSTFPLPPSPSPQPPTMHPLSDESDETEPPTRFDEFWETYSHKVGRAKAEKAYRAALKKPGVTSDLLIASAAAYITWQMEEGKHPEFTKHPTTWLHGEHWTDERPARQAPKTNMQAHLALVEQLAAEERGDVLPFGQIGSGR